MLEVKNRWQKTASTHNGAEAENVAVSDKAAPGGTP
jgi:hypothetical protein